MPKQSTKKCKCQQLPYHDKFIENCNCECHKQEEHWEDRFDKKFSLTKEEIEEGWRISETKIKDFIRQEKEESYEKGLEDGRNIEKRLQHDIIETIKQQLEEQAKLLNIKGI